MFTTSFSNHNQFEAAAIIHFLFFNMFNDVKNIFASVVENVASSQTIKTSLFNLYSIFLCIVFWELE